MLPGRMREELRFGTSYDYPWCQTIVFKVDETVRGRVRGLTDVLPVEFLRFTLRLSLTVQCNTVQSLN